MKRYGDNLPSNCQQAEIEEYHGRAIKVMLAGCAVRNDMLAYIQPESDPPKRKPLNIFSFLKVGQKKPQKINCRAYKTRGPLIKLPVTIRLSPGTYYCAHNTAGDA